MNCGAGGALTRCLYEPSTMKTALRILADRIRPESRNRVPVTVRPTQADVSIAHTIARYTAPAPEEVARALTWGADEKVLLLLATAGWIASRGSGDRLQRAGNHALLVAAAASVAAARLEIAFRPDPARPQDGPRARPRCFVLGKTRRRFPVRPRATHGRFGIRSKRFAGQAPMGAPDACRRALADAHCRAGALGERCRRRIRGGCNPGATAAPLDRISSREGERSCRFLKI